MLPPAAATEDVCIVTLCREAGKSLNFKVVVCLMATLASTQNSMPRGKDLNSHQKQEQQDWGDRYLALVVCRFACIIKEQILSLKIRD